MSLHTSVSLHSNVILSTALARPHLAVWAGPILEDRLLICLDGADTKPFVFLALIWVGFLVSAGWRFGFGWFAFLGLVELLLGLGLRGFAFQMLLL